MPSPAYLLTVDFSNSSMNPKLGAISLIKVLNSGLHEMQSLPSTQSMNIIAVPPTIDIGNRFGASCICGITITTMKNSSYKEISDNGRRVCMCHFPILLYNHSHSPNSYMLCGHVHNTKENDWFEKWRSEIRKHRILAGDGNHGNIINVGCMMPYMDYTPRTLDELIEGVGWRA